MDRYAITIARPDGTIWRTVHLLAADREQALVRAARWCRLERLTGYSPVDAYPEPSPEWRRRAAAGELPPSWYVRF